MKDAIDNKCWVQPMKIIRGLNQLIIILLDNLGFVTVSFLSLSNFMWSLRCFSVGDEKGGKTKITILFVSYFMQD